MKVLVVEPLQVPCVREIDGSLASMQGIVGGLIEVVHPFADDPEIVLVCNDEGKILRLPYNRALKNEDGEVYDIIVGTFFLCAAPFDGGKLAGLTDEQIDKYTERYKNEMVLGV